MTTPQSNPFKLDMLRAVSPYRGSTAVFVGGKMGDASVNRRHGDARAHATSAAIRPDLSEHTVQLVYHGAVHKLYVYMDGEPSPLLAADIDLADADAGSLDARPAHFGFTARANRALAVAVPPRSESAWRLGRLSGDWFRRRTSAVAHLSSAPSNTRRSARIIARLRMRLAALKQKQKEQAQSKFPL